MAKVVVKSKVKKVKRKFPVEIKAPEVFNSISLGNSNVTDLASLVGKTLKINLMYVTKNVKNQNVRIVFEIIDVSSGVANTRLKSYEQIPYYLNRFVKAGSDLITDSILCKSKDGKSIRVKPFIITKNNTSSMVLASIRQKVKELMITEASKNTAEDVVNSVILGKTQLAFRNEVKKLFPLKAFEFKKVIIE